ncbi:Peroxisomal ATPase HuPEX1 [Hanseniaspora uvarum DSM 2768]|nr:Peroxisomal ATPase HuPEX1 [Hanseniaspora uvarum DSM 2768]
MALSLTQLLNYATNVSDFDILFDGKQRNLLSLNEFAADLIDDLNILVQDLFIYSTPSKTVLSWDGSINTMQNTNKFTIIISNKRLFDEVKDCKMLQLSSYSTNASKNVQKYNLMIHNKQSFDQISNNQEVFINRLPEFKRFIFTNTKDFIIMNNKFIEYTLKGKEGDVIKLNSDVELHINYFDNHIKVHNKILDKVDSSYVYVSNYLYSLISKNTSLSKDNKVLENFNIDKVKAIEELDDYQICINYLNLIDNQLQIIGTNDEEFELDLNASVNMQNKTIEKYEYLIGKIVIKDINLKPGINFLNLNNNKIYELHRLCFDCALVGYRVILLDIPFLLNIISDKKLSISDIVNIYILGRKTELKNYDDKDNNSIYEVLRVFFSQFKKLVPKLNKNITIIFKNCDYLFKNDLFKNEEEINSNYYKWQNYFLEFNKFMEKKIIKDDFNIQMLIQSEDYDDDTKIPNFFDDLYLVNNKISNLNIVYEENINDYRDYLNASKMYENYVELSKRPLNISEITSKDTNTLNKPIYGISTTMVKINSIFEKSVLYKKLYQIESNQNLNILLYGLPSMGKTLIINQLSNLLIEKYRIIPTNSYFKYHNTLSLISKYIGESEKNIRSIFSQAREHIKNNNSLYFIVLDNIDTLLPRRGNDNSNITDKLVNTFLTELDGIDSLISNKNLIVVCVTNRPDKIDPAVLRPGRIENHIKVEYDENDYRDLVESSLKDYELEGVNVDDIVKMKDSLTVGGLLKTFNECKMNDSELKVEELAKEKSIILEFNRYFDKFENKVDMESVDTKESYI